MSFEQLAYKSGILGQGCSLQRYLSRPEMIRCRLPALLVLQLMDLGRWQYICGSDDIYLPEDLSHSRLATEQFNDNARQHRDNIVERHVATSASSGASTSSPETTLSQDPITTQAPSSQTGQQLLAGLGTMPLNTLIDAWWTADPQALENAVVRLQQFPEDPLKKRLSRILHSLLATTSTGIHEEHWRSGPSMPAQSGPGSPHKPTKGKP